jgi:nitroreductase
MKVLSMSLNLPHEFEFGQAIPLGERQQGVLNFLATRRSASALALTEPGPDGAQLADLLRLAARVSDHGKLFPWRFIVLQGEAKARFAEGLRAIAKTRPDADKAQSALGKMINPPLAVAVISSPKPGNIAEWEQVLSSGAVCASLVNAASAAGFGANWITDWYAYDQAATAFLGIAAAERVAGFIYIGTPKDAPLERPRPNLAALTTVWGA